MTLYQEIMFGFGGLLLIFGMLLMVFKSSDGGLTKIKLPVVELELNGGALFVMMLGAGMMYFANANLDLAGPKKDDAPQRVKAVEPDALDGNVQERLRAAEEARKIAEERAAAAEQARRAIEDAQDEQARKAAEAKLAALEEKLNSLDRKDETPARPAPAEIGPAPKAPEIVEPTPPPAPAPAIKNASLWDHNQSTMVLVANGDRRKLFYDTPRAALVANGVHNGTLLFEGERQGGSYSGTAYMFSKGCEPLAFKVAGEVGKGDKEVVLRGLAPRRQNCRVVGYGETTLRFTYLKTVRDYRFSAGGE